MSDSFQIRRDLLAMSKDILMNGWQAKVKSLEDTYRQSVEARAISESSFEIGYPEIPPVPTAEQIIRMASELNTWVSATSPSHYRKMKENEQRQHTESGKDPLSPFGLAATAHVPTDTGRPTDKTRGYQLTIRRMPGLDSLGMQSNWERLAPTRQELERIAYNWSDATKQAKDRTWYIDPDTCHAHWSCDNMHFIIKELG